MLASTVMMTATIARARQMDKAGRGAELRDRLKAERERLRKEKC